MQRCRGGGTNSSSNSGSGGGVGRGSRCSSSGEQLQATKAKAASGGVGGGGGVYAPVVVVVVVVLVTEQIPGVVVSMKALPGAGGGRGTYVLLCRLACGVLSIAWSLGQGDDGYYNTNINSNSGKQTVHTSPLHFFLLYFRVHPAPFVIYPSTTD